MLATPRLREVVERIREGDDPQLAELFVDALTELAAMSRADKELLIGMLMDPNEDPSLRRAIAVALGRLGDPDGIAALLEVLQRKGDRHDVRTVAMLALTTDRSGGVDLAPPQITARTSEGFPISLGRTIWRSSMK